MKNSFEENNIIGEIMPNTLSSPSNDSIVIPTDLFDEKNTELPRQNENLEAKSVMELVKEKINSIKIDLENSSAAVDEIIGNLEEQSVKVSEYEKKYIRMVAVGGKMNFLRNLERYEMGEEKIKSEKKKKMLKEMALADAEWIGDFVKYIRENRGDQKKIKELWQRFDEFYLSFNEQSNGEFANKYAIGQGPETIKRGILAEVAAMDLMEGLANSFDKCEKVEVNHSTPKQDVEEKIDFFLKIIYKNGKVAKVPVQVKSCNISNFASRGLSRKKLGEKVRFVLDNIINTCETKNNVIVNQEYTYQTRAKTKMKRFFDKNKEGIFVILPYGNLDPKLLNPQDKNGKTTESCISENGTPSESLRNHFLFEAQTIKNVEMNINA